MRCQHNKPTHAVSEFEAELDKLPADHKKLVLDYTAALSKRVRNPKHLFEEADVRPDAVNFFCLDGSVSKRVSCSRDLVVLCSV